MMPGNDQTPDDTEGGDKPAAPHHEVVAAINSLTRQHEASQKERAELDGKIFLWTKRATLAVGAYTVLTLAGVALTYCALRTAQEANQIQVRPYIKVVLRPETFDVHLGPNRGDYRNDLAALKFRVENVGKTPALTYIQSAANWSGRAHPGDDKHWPSIAVSGRKFLFPDDKDAEFTSYVVGFSRGQLMDIATGDRFYVMVDVLYGPLKNGFPSNAYETKVCTMFQMRRNADSVTLGGGEPCPSEDSNYSK